MRASMMVMAGTLVLLLAACGKTSPDRNEGQAAESNAPAPAAAAAPTEAQKKVLLASLPAAYQSANLDNGEAKSALCKACHTVAKGGGDGVGPNLYGIFGRKAGSEAGFSYSDGLKASGITWDADSLNKWITDPKKVVPTTKMTYLGMEDPKDRTDVVAYLKVASSAPGG